MRKETIMTDNREKPALSAFFKLIILGIAALMLTAAPAAASNNWYILSVEGTADFGKAQEVLVKVNSLRTGMGLNALVMEESLMQTAMYRAAELSVYFSHTRPDGQLCFTANSKMYGENIAAGSSTAEGVYNQWYNSQGHYQNMIDSSWRSIGIGCFRNGGVYYWVQCFSPYTSSAYTETGVKESVAGIRILEDGTPLYFDVNELSLLSGSTHSLQVYRNNAGWAYVRCVLSAGSFDWTSSDSEVASVNAEGRVTAGKPGNATVTASSKDGAKSVSIAITVKKKISEAEIGISGNMIYTGQPCTPQVTVRDGENVLIRGTDYELSFSNNINAGTAAVTVTGKGKYTGSETRSFAVSPAPVTSVTLSAQRYVYNGRARKPDITVKAKVGTGQVVLRSGADYSIIFRNNVKPGTASVTVAARGNYEGTFTKNFTIVPKAPTILSVSPGKKSFTVKWKKQTVETSGFVVQYALNGAFTSGKKIVALKKNTYAARRVAGLVAGRRYYVRVQAFKTIGTKRYYSNWSAVKTVTPRAR